MNFEEMQVLVVDDSRIMRRIVEQKLGKMGISHVVMASNGRNALDVLNQGGISLIISDWSMPGMTGIDLLEKLRNESPRPDIPFIFLSAEAQLYNILMAYRLRADEYITKPFTNDYFQYVVEKVVARYYKKNGIGK